ncbi:Fe2+-dependent dioxygenase [Prochlorococcus marinus XMU1410]|uniref:Fe2+-dependent dioxygenase n=1 Tax=Prochlorococcus marinus TaxID=1219 RepID=UPI001ADC659B|nr:Fe2+-dependent dioxygenase [Prochlorococcus marinus]MBO8242302.1 Fe2+-dependent dioxygenase [Prochlorococcus marinus XMU1410]MBW3053450.1 Fe2+-dependent dioxygenase [Prochlorococcus marinus str. MU1410]
MNYLTHQLLNAEEINFIKKELDEATQDWEDGKKTAGSHASKVKNNLQLNRNSEVSKNIAQLVNKKILSSQLIKSFSLPKKIHGIMFTKSLNNMHYGRHIDNPYMCSGRSDLSFTLSLTNKESYKGGELIIETMNSEERFKLNAGEIILYPSSYLHAVNEVNNGERLVCVGWIESYVKSTEKRGYLFDLDAGAISLLAKHGRSDELDLIFKSYSNLLRVMGD